MSGAGMVSLFLGNTKDERRHTDYGLTILQKIAALSIILGRSAQGPDFQHFTNLNDIASKCYIGWSLIENLI